MVPSRELKHQLFIAALVDGEQSVKLIVSSDKLPERSGFPPQVLSKFPDGIPLDIRSNYPLNPDCDGDGVAIDLSFGGVGCRCYIPWDAVDVFAIGLGGVFWEHEVEPEPAPTPTELPAGVADLSAFRKRK